MATTTLRGSIGFAGFRQQHQQPLGPLGFRKAAADFFFPAPGRIAAAKRSGDGGLTLRVSSVASVVETKPRDSARIDDGIIAKENILACPVCYRRLTLIGPPISVNMTTGSTLQCDNCKKSYLGNETHVDLIAASGLKEYTESTSMVTELFRSRLISYVYERGWRQGFAAMAGFPGPEQEFEMMKEYLQPVFGGNIIDASCGSGPFTRLFAKSGLFSQVIALDYSENMLRECYEFIKKEEGCPKENMTLVRADISRLPFATASIDAVHAGAAIHCWPSPSVGVAEVSRVLRPGGVFVATTSIVDGGCSLLPFLKPFRTKLCQSQCNKPSPYCNEEIVREIPPPKIKRMSGDKGRKSRCGGRKWRLNIRSLDVQGLPTSQGKERVFFLKKEEIGTRQVKQALPNFYVRKAALGHRHYE